MTKKLALVLVASAVILLISSFARAEVRDNAGLFSADAVRQADQRIAKLGVPVVVETYAALPDEMLRNYNLQRKDQAFQEFAKRRVQQVASGGVYVIVTTNPNYVNVTESTKHTIRGADADAVRNAMIHPFSERRFDEGLLRGLDAMSHSTGLRGGAAPAGGAVERSPQGQAASSPQTAPPAGRSASRGSPSGRSSSGG